MGSHDDTCVHGCPTMCMNYYYQRHVVYWGRCISSISDVGSCGVCDVGSCGVCDVGSCGVCDVCVCVLSCYPIMCSYVSAVLDGVCSVIYCHHKVSCFLHIQPNFSTYKVTYTHARAHTRTCTHIHTVAAYFLPLCTCRRLT